MTGPRDRFGERVEVGDVVRLLDVDPPADHALVEGVLGDDSLMVRRFDRAAGEWHTTRRRWCAWRVRRDMWRGCMAEGQRNNATFVDRLREW